ncbi:hypothetical protein [Flavobacterium tegetincola]|uniref:hypothetical protein n=1 Tax=Flavobacterium tegetincola TaxID=150172 RepID=UPI00040B4884|nr:hypothetical protein [Flavobacterium tegetincola]
MKKFIFSAVAMMAFVGSSMANTSDIKKILTDDPKFFECFDKAIAYADQNDPEGLWSDAVANAVHQQFMSDCLKEVEKPKTKQLMQVSQ